MFLSSIENHLSPHSQVYLANNLVSQENAQEERSKNTSEKLKELQIESQQLQGKNGENLSFCDPEILDQYAKLPLENITLNNLNFPTNSEIVLVFGGETHGISLMARKLALDNYGASIYVPLKNQIDSLNVACAASVILYQFVQKYTSLSE